MTTCSQLEECLQLSKESAIVEFKALFNPARPCDWLEITKDIVALANSGGGVILIGINDDGSPSGEDVSAATKIDPADLTNRLYKYTNTQFHAFDISACEKEGQKVCAITVRDCKIPIVFTRVGTYEPEPGRQKTAFSVGTVYFRHGAKSEPGTSDDLRDFLERELKAIRYSWLDSIAKIVEAPTGSRFAVLPPDGHPVGPSGALPLRLTNDPDAQPYYAVPIDSTHPFRQKEVIREVNALLPGGRNINAHDILSIRRVHQIQKDIALCYTQNFASPRYSQAFVEWIIRQYEADNGFFEKAKIEYEAQKGVVGVA